MNRKMWLIISGLLLIIAIVFIAGMVNAKSSLVKELAKNYIKDTYNIEPNILDITMEKFSWGGKRYYVKYISDDGKSKVFYYENPTKTSKPFDEHLNDTMLHYLYGSDRVNDVRDEFNTILRDYNNYYGYTDIKVQPSEDIGVIYQKFKNKVESNAVPIKIAISLSLGNKDNVDIDKYVYQFALRVFEMNENVSKLKSKFNISDVVYALSYYVMEDIASQGTASRGEHFWISGDIGDLTESEIEGRLKNNKGMNVFTWKDIE